ncbi:MAG: PDZ domain-containing protein [Bacteroidia bacterium]
MKKTIYILAVLGLGLFSFKAADDYFEISKNLDIFASAYKEVNTSYVDEVKPGELIRAAINGMLKSLDPYTVYYSEAQQEDYKYQVTGTYAGVGATIRKVGENVVVDAPFSGFPADKAGLRAGDIILTVDGKSMLGKSTSEVTDHLKGKAGTTLNMKVKRPGAGELSFNVEREQIKRKNVPYAKVIKGNVGYIKLTGFTPGAANEVKKALVDLKSQGAASIILDLRGNGGGLLHEAINIVNLFVPKGETVVVTRGKLKEEDRIYKTLNFPVDTEIPLVMFIDGRSASASEIVTGALQDFDRAVLIGRNSFGKGLVQGTKKLTYNTQMKVTIAKYYLPSGRLIQRLDYGNRVNGRVRAVADSAKQTFYTRNNRAVVDGEGIQPDIEIEMSPYTKIAQSIISNNHAFNYAVNMRNSNVEIPTPIDFNVDEDLYNNFVSYLSDKEYEYETATELALQNLIKKAEAEEMSEHMSKDIVALENAIEIHKDNDLEHHKEELMELLEYEIASNYYLERGKIESSFDDDPDLKAALDLLSKPQKMNELLGR